MSNPGGVWAKVYPDAMVLGNGRNLLYNGAMQVAQRGTSTASITSGGYYTADRWAFSPGESPNNAGTWTNSVEVDAPTGSGFGKSFKVLCTTDKASLGSTDGAGVYQQFEGQDLQRVAKGTASAQQLTLSFWVKSNVTGTYIVYLYDNDNDRICALSYSISAGATWEKKTLAFPADTTGVLDNDNELSMQVYFSLAGGSDLSSGTLQTTWATYSATNSRVGQTNLAAAAGNYWQVTGVQLEVGETATSFEHKKYGTELAECHRYYQVIADQSASGDKVSFAMANGFNTSYIYGVMNFQPMRTFPSMIHTIGTDYYYCQDNTSHTTSQINGWERGYLDRGRIHMNGVPGITVGRSYLVSTGNNNSRIALEAEL